MLNSPLSVLSRLTRISLLSLPLLFLYSCDSKQDKKEGEKENKNAVNQTSNEIKLDKNSPSSTQVESESSITEYNIFNKEDTAGTFRVEKSGNQVSAKLKMGWNNRRVETEEEFTVNEQGFITSQSIKGISAFGAPVSENFIINDGIANWKSNNETGQAATDGKKFYIPIDGTGAINDYLIKALLKDEDNKVDLLPSGSASLIKLNSVNLIQGTQTKTVHLIGITGFGFTPNFAWYDDDNNFFATDGGGWFGVIPKGWGREHLEQLSKVQKKAENDHLQQLAKKLTHVSEKPILITNANYVDVLTGQLLKNKIIEVANGKIKSIDDMSDRQLSIEGQYITINANGKTLIPGLWDMHGHLSKSDGLLNLPAGVTSVRDMGNTHDNILDIELLGAANQIMGGDVYRAGFMDRESPYAMKMGKTADSLESAKQAVDWYAENGYPQIKTYSSMEPEWVKPLAEHIHKKGMRLSGHIPAFMTAEEAVKAGFDEIQHINMLFLNFLGKNVDTRKRLRFTLVGEKAHTVDLEGDEFKAFMKLLKDSNTTIDPTISVFRSLLQAKAGDINPEVVAIYDHLPVTVARGFKTAILNIKDDEREDYNKSTQALNNMVKKLYEYGIDIVPGTDGIAGFTLHRELIVYSEAGIPNAEVLKLATIGSAKIVGAQDKTGSINVGKNADLVFVDGNPLEDMNALRKISLVIKGQRLYKPDQIYQEIGVKPFTQSIHFSSN